MCFLVYYFSTVAEILDICLLLLFFIRLHCIITLGMITDIADTFHPSARSVVEFDEQMLTSRSIINSRFNTGLQSVSWF
jgi:hypothetical protein